MYLSVSFCSIPAPNRKSRIGSTTSHSSTSVLWCTCTLAEWWDHRYNRYTLRQEKEAMHSNHSDSNGFPCWSCWLMQGLSWFCYSAVQLHVFHTGIFSFSEACCPYEWFLLPWPVSNQESVESLRNCIPLWCADGLASNGNWSPGRLASGCNLPRHSVAGLQWVENRHNLSDPWAFWHFLPTLHIVYI